MAASVVSAKRSAVLAGNLNEDQENIMKANNAKANDCLSDLPDEILSFILSFLTMRDAVKSRVLSPRWRYLCASTTNLKFDLFTLFGINYSIVYMPEHRARLWEDKLRFVRAVDQFLQMCRSPKLYSFKVCYGLGSESSCHIDRWIGFAIRMQAEKLVLNLSFIPEGCKLYIFPCHLLSQGKASHLKHLCLQSCTLRPGPDLAKCLNSLKILDLNNVPLDQSAFDAILSGCINLERLRLQKCSLPVSFFICVRLLCLKSLVLDYCDGVAKIELSCTDLTTFEYFGVLINLKFVGVSSLEKVHLRFMSAYQRGINYMFDGLAKDLPQLHALSLDLLTHEICPIPANMTKFNHLKELELYVFLSSDFDLFSVVFILNASPCLQKCHLALSRWSGGGPLVKREYSKQLYHQLKDIELSGFRDLCNALGLAMYLLSSAVRLERMIVNSHVRRYCGAGSWRYGDTPRMDESQKEWVHGVLMNEKEKVNPNVELTVL